MASFNWQKELWRDGHRVIFSGQPFAMHCHHYNINLLKTLEETLQGAGVALLFRSTEEANFVNFQFLFRQYPMLKSARSRLEIASIMYQNCGLGILHFQDVQLSGGTVVSPSSHHVTGWLAKHGRRTTPGCHFARGWIAGALEAIFEMPLGTYEVTEIRCKLIRNDECVFRAQIGEAKDGH